MRKRKCDVCLDRAEDYGDDSPPGRFASGLCRRCHLSYERHRARNGGFICDIIQWAARRARAAERKRAKL